MSFRSRSAAPAFALVLSLVWWLHAGHALAQQDVDTQVRALMRQGETAVTEGRFAAAESAYEKAYALKPGFDVAANLADAERKLEKFAEAAAHYAVAVRTFPSSFDQKTKKSLQTALAEMQTKVATVDIEVSEAGATIVVDKRDVGKSPLSDPLFLMPGAHTVEARSGDKSASQPITAEAGARQSVNLQLVVQQVAEASPHPMPALLITGGALAAVGIGVGIGLTVTSFSKSDEADELLGPFLKGQRCSSAPAECDAIDDALGASDDLAIGAVVSFVAGGAFAAATLVYWLASPNGDAVPDSTAVLPLIAPSAAGVTITGTF